MHGRCWIAYDRRYNGSTFKSSLIWQLRHVLVAQCALHSKFLQSRWFMHVLVVVIRMWYAILCLQYNSTFHLCEVSAHAQILLYVFEMIYLILPFSRHPKMGKALTLATVVVNLAYTFYIGITMNYKFSFETTTALFTELYMNSVSRVLAYVIGGMAGWFFVQNQQKQRYANFFQNQSLQEFLGYLAIICFFACNFAKVSEGYSVVFYVALLTVQRLVFSSSVCCLIFANAAGSVKWFFGILENPLFKKFNQITYALFLVNPLPMVLLTSLNNASRYASLSNMVS